MIFSASSPTAGSHCTSLSLVAASCPQHLKGRSFLKQRRGRSCCLALAANGATKGTVILSHPFVLLGEVHQITGISKRQGKAVSNLCHPPLSSCSIPCCYPVYTVQETIGSKKSTPKHGCCSAFCGLGHTATSLLPAYPSHTHGPTQQTKASSNATTGPWKEPPCPFP